MPYRSRRPGASTRRVTRRVAAKTPYRTASKAPSRPQKAPRRRLRLHLDRGLATGVVLWLMCFTGLSLLGLVGYVGAVGSETFRVREVQVVGHRLSSAATLVRLAGLDRPASLLALSPDKIGRTLAQAPYVKSASVSRGLTGTVVISIEEFTPYALVRLGGLYYVDPTGVVFKKVEPGEPMDLPVITGLDPKTEVGPRAPQSRHVRRAVEFLARLDRHGGMLARQNVSEVVFDPDRGFAVTLLTGPAWIGFGFDRIDQKLRRLSVVLTKLKAMGRAGPGHLVDLDYRDRVVVRVGRGAS